MLETAVAVSNLTKCFGPVLAVDHINFEVESEEVFGFLGPNGAGKTTTIRMLTGVIKPDEGSARVMGYDVLRETLKVKQIIGVVPEVANAYIDLTAWQNLMLIGELYGVSKRKRTEKAGNLLKELGLYERRNQLVRGFSRGMKQRLIFCMALVNEPQMLFLDEPTSGLDVESARHIRELIREYNDNGKTIFLSTHNMDEANRLCDRIAIINYGKIVAVDSPERLRMKSSGLQSVEVGFDKPVDIDELSYITGVREVKKMGDKIRLYTNNPDKIIDSLVDYARSKNLQFISLNTLNPSLEDVFVELTREH
jgi:ABC-2 type transport system ATP-binding protein